MVSARMIAVFAVSLLLICSRVESADDMEAAITQVSYPDASSPAPAPEPTTENSNLNTTVGDSSNSRSAVLSTVEGMDINEHATLYDLTRHELETIKAGPPSSAPSAESPVPDGFDMKETDDSSAIMASNSSSNALAKAPGPSLDTEGYVYDPSEVNDSPVYATQTYQDSFTTQSDRETTSEGGTLVGSSLSDSSTTGLSDSSYSVSYANGYQPIYDTSGYSFSTQTGPVYDYSKEINDQSGNADQYSSYSSQGTGDNTAVDTDAARHNREQIYEIYAKRSAAAKRKATTYRPRTSYGGNTAGGGNWRNGRCTFYGGTDASGTMSGACGYGNLYASGYGILTTALSTTLFKNGLACGACYEVRCTGSKGCKKGSVVVTATNFCPPNPGQSASNGGWCNPPNDHFDLSYPAFARIADPNAGVVPLTYRRVNCASKGGIKFSISGNCNFNLVTVTNVGGSGVVTAAYMKGDYTGWIPMSRSWGANWQCSHNFCGQSLLIKVVTSDGKVAISRIPAGWAFGRTYVGSQIR